MTDRYATLRRGLVGAWCPSLGGDSARVLRDRANRNCNLAGSGTSLVAVPGGVALQLPGSTSTAATNAVIQRGLNGRQTGSLSMWLHKAASNAVVAGGFTGDASSGNRFSMLWFSDGNLYCPVEAGTGNFYLATHSGSGWRHIVLTFDGSAASAINRAAVYIGGVPQTISLGSAENTFPTALSSALGTFALGRDDNARVSNGSIDDARVYDRVLTLAEIKLLASQRGIGLVPTRHRRARLAASAATTMWLNVGGTWKTTTPHINVGGTWKQATPKIRVSGTWKG